MRFATLIFCFLQIFYFRKDNRLLKIHMSAQSTTTRTHYFSPISQLALILILTIVTNGRKHMKNFISSDCFFFKSVSFLQKLTVGVRKVIVVSTVSTRPQTRAFHDYLREIMFACSKGAQVKFFGKLKWGKKPRDTVH